MPANAIRHYFPALGILIGASLWGVIWYPLRLLESGGLNGLWLVLTVYAAAFIASLPFLWSAWREFVRQPGPLFLLMLAAGWTNIAFFEAVLGGNVLRALLLFYLSPLWAVALGYLVLHEQIGRTAKLSLVVAMTGAVIMLWNPSTGIPWPHSVADWMALSSGFAFAVSNVLVRKMTTVTVAAKSLAVWSGVVVMALGALALLQSPAPQATPVIFLGAIALGAMGILVMTLLVQYGVTHLPVHRSAVLALIELVAGAASQQLLSDEIVTAREWLGGVLILAGAWFSARATGPERANRPRRG
jgi:drug/metabolite transporter (DMT)-like permease